jgi:fimbrial chaperone protein
MSVVFHSILRGLLPAAFLFFGAGNAFPGDFRVTPIKLAFTANAKSGVITIINEGKTKINLQISASEWTQDGKGKDVYTETADIVFYPKIMALETGEQRVIRAGIKGPQPLREKTYRLFIEEIPERKKADEGKSQVSIVIRFAPPIFVRPLVESRSGSLEKVELAKGKLTAVVRNTGNVHATITAVTVQARASDGREVFAKDISGWYLLNGVSRPYEAAIPRDACLGASTVEVTVKADTFTLSRTVNVLKDMCKP